MLSFFPRDVLGEILNLIESVSEGFPSYSCTNAEEVLRNRTLTSRVWKIEFGLYAPPP